MKNEELRIKSEESVIRFVGQVPSVEEGGSADVRQLLPVQAVGVVGRLVVVGMPVRVIPDDRDIPSGKGGIVASAHGPFPCAVVRLQAEALLGDVAPQPLSESRMGGGVEIHHVARMVFAVVAPYHVEIQVALDVLCKGAALQEGFRAQQAQFFPVPKSDDNRA